MINYAVLRTRLHDHSMNIILPEVRYVQSTDRKARRPRSLSGLTLAILQNEGSRGEAEGQVQKQHPFAHLAELMTERFELSSIVWYAKPMKTMVAPPAQLREIAQRAHVAITGVCI